MASRTTKWMIGWCFVVLSIVVLMCIRHKPPMSAMPEPATIRTQEAVRATATPPPVLHAQEAHEAPVISGIVRFASGKPVSNATVWLERIQGATPSVWERAYSDTRAAVGGKTVSSDANGAFVLNRFDTAMVAIVKAKTERYPTVSSEAYCATNPPPACVKLVVDDPSGRMMGTFTDILGKPVTNVTVRHCVEALDPISLDIAADGTFVSSLMPATRHGLVFVAKGYEQVVKFVRIACERTEIVDVRFASETVVTGVVRDAGTRVPIVGVQIRNIDYYEPLSGKVQTASDANGVFLIKPGRFTFSHPNYVTESVDVYSRQLTNELEVMLSYGADVLVRIEDAAGTPVSNVAIRLSRTADDERWDGRNGIATNSEILFSGVPTGHSPLRASAHRIRQRESSASREIECLLGEVIPSESEPFSLDPGATANVTVRLSAMGRMLLRFAKPMMPDTVSLQLHRRIDGAGWDDATSPHNLSSDCYVKCDGCDIAIEMLLPGEYIPVVRGKEVPFYGTNVQVVANETTVVEIPDESNSAGAIRGTVRDAKGRLLDCHISIDLQGPCRPAGGVICDDRSIDARNGWFEETGLRLDQRYSVCVGTDGAANQDVDLRDIVPNGPPLDIVMPVAYRVTGRVRNSDGSPATRVSIANADTERDSGEFRLPQADTCFRPSRWAAHCSLP